MSALGQKRTSEHVQSMSALPPKADIGTQSRNVRFVPKADIGTSTRVSPSTQHSGSLAILAAIGRALSFVSNLASMSALKMAVSGPGAMHRSDRYK